MVFVPPIGYGIITLDPGIPVVVLNDTVTGIGGPGIAFTVQPRGDGADRDVELLGIPNGVTALTVDLEVSADQGVTWQKKVVGITLIVASVSTVSKQTLMPGFQYRVNATTVTGGTSADVIASVA